MQYLLLVYTDAELMAKLPEAEFATEMRACLQHSDAQMAEGKILGFQQLQPPATARTVRTRNGRTAVLDGPFAETKELIAGFWLWQVRSMDEAIEWVRRCPSPHVGDCEIEIRPVFEAEDFGEALTPEIQAQNAALRPGQAKA